MMTSIYPMRANISRLQPSTQNETGLTVQEVFRRARTIRMKWSASEKARRRQEADRRFEVLLDTLFSSSEAV